MIYRTLLHKTLLFHLHKLINVGLNQMNVCLCHLLYEPNSPGPSVRAISELSHLNVQVLPSRPDYIKVDNIQDKTSSEHKLANSVFLEGDVISVTCAGEVGKPIRNLIVQKMRTHGMDYNLTQVESPVNEGIPKCSFYQNNTFTTTLTGEDNGSILRNAVEGFTNNDNLSIKTNQLVVMYPVQIPDIHVYPSTSTMPPVTLHCIGKGNPEPYFAWYKLSKINITNSFEFLASTPVITLNKTSDSGVYRCEVYNNIAQNSYRNSSNVTVTFQENPNTDIDSETDKSCYCVPAVLGGVFGSLGICIVPLAIVYISKHRSSKRNKETKCPTTSIPDQDLSSQYEEIRRETDNRHTEAARHLSSSYEGIGSERTNHEYSELQ